jgi:hypothetical protein
LGYESYLHKQVGATNRPENIVRRYISFFSLSLSLSSVCTYLNLKVIDVFRFHLQIFHWFIARSLHRYSQGHSPCENPTPLPFSLRDMPSYLTIVFNSFHFRIFIFYVQSVGTLFKRMLCFYFFLIHLVYHNLLVYSFFLSDVSIAFFIIYFPNGIFLFHLNLFNLSSSSIIVVLIYFLRCYCYHKRQDKIQENSKHCLVLISDSFLHFSLLPPSTICVSSLFFCLPRV